ncbi:MAG TPA: DsrE family protein [Bacteroidales bacterium]|nr:DsrE family protein [Bacteroidales bacterium]
MKIKLFFLVLVFSICSAKFLMAQDGKIATPSDTLIVLWSSGDADVAEKACLMYAHAAKKFNWFREVILVVWGPSEKLLAEDSKLKDKIASMKKDGVIIEACVACSNMYGVTNDLKVCEVDVKGMGVPLTHYLKRGYKIVSY